MDIVLGVSMEPTSVRMVLIEGENADGVTVEEDTFEAGAAAQVVAAIIGTREGAAESRFHLMSTGVTWTDPAGVSALREELTARDVGAVMLVSPLLAAAALAQTVGLALNYEHIAMLFVEAGSATLAVVDIADGSIVDLHRQPLRTGPSGATAAELVTMLAGLDAPGSRADGVFVIGCGVDIVGLKPVLDAATSLAVSAPEEPDTALARGAALASANAPLFASSTAALAYALDPGTGEVSPRALTPTYLDICANADRGEGALAYSALDDEDPDEDSTGRRRPIVLAGSTLAGAAAIVAGLFVVSSDVRPTAVQEASPPVGVMTPAIQVSPVAPPEAQLPAPSPPPAAPAPEVAAPPAPPPAVQQQPPPAPANMAPVTPRRAPVRQAPQPVQEAPQAAPMTTPPAAVPPPAPPTVEAPPPTPIATMHLRLPFVTIPIPIYPPAPPPPPPEPGPPGPVP
jgi:hypothetical protein